MYNIYNGKRDLVIFNGYTYKVLNGPSLCYYMKLISLML